MKYAELALGALMLVSCAGNVVPPARAEPASPRPNAAIAPTSTTALGAGLQAVMGKDIGTLKRLFGEPRLDVVEVIGRKLQFTGKACILDLYLYPDGRNGAEIVTYVDARRSDGAAVDRASCVEALQRR